jgi:hypothetical protein
MRHGYMNDFSKREDKLKMDEENEMCRKIILLTV